MASGSGVTLDKVTIQIQAASKDANTNIRDLSKTLQELKDATKGGFNNLKKLSDALKELNKASKGVPTAVENLSQIKKVTTALKNLSSITTPTGLKSAVANLEKLPTVFSQIDTNVLDNVSRVSDRLATSLSPLAEKLSQISMGLSALSRLAKNYGVSVTKVASSTKTAARESSKLYKSLIAVRRGFALLKSNTVGLVDKTLKPLKKLHSKIKQIGLSLLGTRTIFTMTRKAVSEYMAMDQQLTDSIQNTWRALGAQLAPAIEYVMYLFKQFVRVIYSIVYALTGIDLIARANARALAAMNKSAKDALGSLQKFDDLNVAEFDKGSGDDMQIELDKIDLTPIQEVIDWMKRLKEEIQKAWKTGEWNGVATVLADGINSAIDSIDPEKLANKIGGAILKVLDFIKTGISKIEWYEIGVKIRETIEGLPWKEIWDGIVEIAKESFGGLGEFVNGLFGADEDSKFGENLIISLLGVWGMIQLIRGATGFGGILTDLGLIAKAPSFATILGVLGGIFIIVMSIKQGFDSWKEFFEDPSWQTFWPAFYDTLLTIAGVIGGIAVLFGAWPVALVAAIAMVVILVGKFLSENLDNINQWAYDLGKSLGEWLSKQWNKLKEWWGKKKTKISDAASNIGKTIGNGIKTGIEWAINKVIDGFNWVKKQLNKFSFDVPDWVPGIGGEKWGFDLKMSDHVKLETGTNEIPYEGLYHLHEGEAVVPKKYNPALGNGTNEETNQRLDTLIYLMENMNFTNIVNVGNETLYKKQQAYNKKQNDKYGTTVNL